MTHESPLGACIEAPKVQSELSTFKALQVAMSCWHCLCKLNIFYSLGIAFKLAMKYFETKVLHLVL